MHFYFIFPRFKLLSGAERLILCLAGQVARGGHRCTVVAHTLHPTCRDVAARNDIAVIETGRPLDRYSNRYLNAIFDYLSSISLTRFITDREAGCVFFGPALVGLAWFRWVRRRSHRCLYFCYEPPRFAYRDTEDILERTGWAAPLLRPGFALYRWLDRLMSRAPDEILTQGAFGSAEIERIYARSATIIPHGSELEFVARPARAGMRILTVNFLHPRKRLDIFLRTIGLLRSRGVDATGVIVGDGPERGRLSQLAHEIGVEGAVEFSGYLGDRELAQEYERADAYLHTARLESFGLAVLDALRSGLPVVSVSEGGPIELIADGETGYLRPCDPAALASPLSDLAADPSLRVRIGAAASAAVRDHYTWEAGGAALLAAMFRGRI